MIYAASIFICSSHHIVSYNQHRVKVHARNKSRRRSTRNLAFLQSIRRSRVAVAIFNTELVHIFAKVVSICDGSDGYTINVPSYP